MKNSCSSVSRFLEKYFDGEVTNKERILVEAHLQDCSSCRHELKSMEDLKAFIRAPVEEAAEKEDFPWVWQKIEKEIRLQKKLTPWQSIRSWLDLSPLFRRRVWIPAAATFVALLLITAQIIFETTPSYSDASVVEYVESQTGNVMVYQSEKQGITVIWLFEGPEKEQTTT